MPASQPVAVEVRRAPIGGAEFVWLEAGTARDGRGPLVLVHGFTGHRDDFAEILPTLARHRRVLAPDLRGHGDSVDTPGPCGFGFDQLVKDLVDFLDHHRARTCDLLGHSMGGMLTLRLALAHPERVRSLIFLCSAPELPGSLPRAGFEAAAGIADARGMDGLQALMEKAGRADCSPTIAAWGERYWLHQRRRLGAMTPASYRAIGSAFFDAESLVDRLPEISAPTLVLVGEFDADFLPGAALFEKGLPNAVRTTLGQAEHHPHQENPEAFRRAIESHFARVERDFQPIADDANERNEA